MAWNSDSARTKTWATEILTATDLHAQLDVLHTYLNDSLNKTTGHAHTGADNHSPKITLTAAAGVTGVLPVANGGTGKSTLETLGDLFYPVGIVITLGVSTNPNTLLGFGTWTAIAGKVIVGIDAGQTEFDTLNETGGTKTNDASHTHTATTAGAEFAGGGELFPSGSYSGHRHSLTTSNSGSATQNNLQPYIVKYCWERTA